MKELNNDEIDARLRVARQANSGPVQLLKLTQVQTKTGQKKQTTPTCESD